MRTSDWNEFLDANEAHVLTLTLDQRNLIADAGQHIDWLESRKRFSEEQAAELLAVLETFCDKYSSGAPVERVWEHDIAQLHAAIDKARGVRAPNP